MLHCERLVSHFQFIIYINTYMVKNMIFNNYQKRVCVLISKVKGGNRNLFTLRAMFCVQGRERMNFTHH